MYFTKFTKEVMTRAGWSPGRSVEDIVDQIEMTLRESDSWEIFPAARSVLLEFGGIKVDQHGAGETIAREPFHIDPLLAIGERDRFDPFESVIGKRLYPIGEAATGHYFLAIAEDGETFLLMHNLVPIGKSFVEAIENLVRGIRP